MPKLWEALYENGTFLGNCDGECVLPRNHQNIEKNNKKSQRKTINLSTELQMDQDTSPTKQSEPGVTTECLGVPPALATESEASSDPGP